MDHIAQHDAELAAAIESNTVHYQKIFADVIDDYIKKRFADNGVNFMIWTINNIIV